MRIRVTACLTLALVLLAPYSTTSHPQSLYAQAPLRTKVDVPRDDIDKILLEEAKQDKPRAIGQLKEKIKELDRKHDDLVYELINLRTKLKRAVDGLGELDPGQASDTRRVRSDEGAATQRSKDNHIRPVPSPKTARERDEALKKFEDQAALAAKLEAESSYMVMQLRKTVQRR
jgi:hypothetical protein